MKVFTTFKLITLSTLVVAFVNGSAFKTLPPTGEEFGEYYTIDDFKTVDKYDAHVHVNTEDSVFLKQAQEDNFRVITINWDDANDPPPMEAQQKFALQQIKFFPGRISYAT